MDIIYSHVKEPIRKGKTPAEVFKEFRLRIEESYKEAKPEDKEKQDAKAADIAKLKSAIGLAWDEVRPIALMNRNLERKQALKDKAPVRPDCDDLHNNNP